MWIFTSDGFVSAVEHREDANWLMVRARDKKSLENLVAGSQMAGAAEGEKELELTDIYSEKHSDYAWRIIVSKATFAIWVQFEVMNMITYPNFKSEAAKYRDAQWMRSLHGVWAEMNKVDEAPKAAYGSYGAYDYKRGVDYNRVFSSPSDYDRDLYSGYGGIDSPMFRDDDAYGEPSDDDLNEIEEAGLTYVDPAHSDYDYLKGRFTEGSDGTLRWQPYTEDELRTLAEEGITSDFYQGEVFFRKNEHGEWVDINDTKVPVLPEPEDD